MDMEEFQHFSGPFQEGLCLTTDLFPNFLESAVLLIVQDYHPEKSPEDYFDSYTRLMDTCEYEIGQGIGRFGTGITEGVSKELYGGVFFDLMHRLTMFAIDYIRDRLGDQWVVDINTPVKVTTTCCNDLLSFKVAVRDDSDIY
jgi:hypothetical protein